MCPASPCMDPLHGRMIWPLLESRSGLILCWKLSSVSLKKFSLKPQINPPQIDLSNAYCALLSQADFPYTLMSKWKPNLIRMEG
jgi:hypothetical protein